MQKDFILCGECEKKLPVPEELESIVKCPFCGYGAKVVEAPKNLSNNNSNSRIIDKIFLAIFIMFILGTLTPLVCSAIWEINIAFPTFILLGILLGGGVFYLLNKIQLTEKGKKISAIFANGFYVLGFFPFIFGVYEFSLPLKGLGALFPWIILLLSYIPLGLAILLNHFAQRNGKFLIINLVILLSMILLIMSGP